MWSATDKKARSEAMLGELAELGLMVARELAVRLRGSEDAGETVALAGAFHKASRAVRLTLALDAKLDRDAARDAAMAAKDAQAQAQADAAAEAAEPRRADLRAAAARRPSGRIEAPGDPVLDLLSRIIWNEAEGDEEDYEALFEDFDARLDKATLRPEFADLPVEAVAWRVITDMGLSPGIARSLGEPQKAERIAPAREPQPADSG
jgi:hypothetical protein